MANTRAQQRRANAEAAKRRRQAEAAERQYRSQFDTSVASMRDTGISNQSRIFSYPEPQPAPRPEVNRRGRPVNKTGVTQPAQPTTRRPRTPPTPSNKTSAKPVTFGTAFKNARDAGQKTFMYQNSRFTTQTKEEAKKPQRTSEFGSAFATARRAGKKTFSFQGKKFNTNLK